MRGGGGGGAGLGSVQKPLALKCGPVAAQGFDLMLGSAIVERRRRKKLSEKSSENSVHVVQWSAWEMLFCSVLY